MNKKKTTDDFISKAISKHGDKYDYSLSVYTGWDKKIKIICPIHGIFEQSINSHLQGRECKKCGIEKLKKGITSNTEDFIKKSKLIHGDKYDYSIVNYKNSYTKIKIICPIHGIFEQEPSNHLTGYNCTKCNKSYRLTNEDFIKKSKLIHDDKYDYSLTKFKNIRTKVKIICPKHGIFEQLAANHLKMGCDKCGIESRKITFLEFLKMSEKVHKNKYDYSLVEYIDFDTKIKIICPKHGIFEQNPSNHIKLEHGCPICKESKGEKKIREHLKELNIFYECQKTFKDCIYKRPLKFDFFIRDYNLCLEYDGIQHFESIDVFGGDDELENLKTRDQIKNEYCKNNNIHLFRIKYNENIIKSLNKILDNFKT